MSTTAVLKWAHQQADGNLSRAIDILYSARQTAAYRVLVDRRKMYPHATTFSFDRTGFVEVQ